MISVGCFGYRVERNRCEISVFRVFVELDNHTCAVPPWEGRASRRAVAIKLVIPQQVQTPAAAAATEDETLISLQ
jgi:hypothetical protein